MHAIITRIAAALAASAVIAAPAISQAATTTGTGHAVKVLPASDQYPKGLPAGARTVTFGKRPDGQRFAYRWTEGAVHPKPVPATVVCNLTVDKISEPLTPRRHFHFEVTEHCSGDFGEQSLRGEVRRTSYDGYRIYMKTGWRPPLGTTDEHTWTIINTICRYHHGIYNYWGAGQSETIALGLSPWILTKDTLNRKNCGPSV